MIGQRRFGVLGQALLLLGVIPLPPPREPEVDIAAAEKAMQDLAAAGISGSDVMEAAGSPHRFVETAQKCLSMQGALAAQGRPSVDVPYLLAQHDDLIRGPLPTRPALHGFEGLSNPREGVPAPRRPYPAPAAAPAKPQPSAEDKRRAACREARKHRRAGRDARPDEPSGMAEREHDVRAAARKTKAAKKARRGW